MKNIVAVSLMSLLVFTSCSRKQEKGTGLEKIPLLVKAEKVKKGSLSLYFHYKGTVAAWRTANIIPDASGRIGKILKKQGDPVRQGELLAVLDLTALELQQKQASAAQAVAQAAYQDARLNAERMKKMFENKAISQMQNEKAQLALNAADTQLKSAKANLDLAEYTLKNSYMRAPFAGIVTAKNMEEGDMINPMMGMGQSILTLMDLTRVKILIDVPSEEIEKILVGQKCRIRISSYENEFFWGEVYSKNLAADPSSKTFKVEVAIANPGMRIKPGVYADISIEYVHRDDILLLPVSALLQNGEVMVAENGVARKRNVKVGIRSGTVIEIISGVDVGEMVLTEGNYDLKEGTTVTIAGEKK